MDAFLGSIFWFIPLAIVYAVVKGFQRLYQRVANLEMRLEAIEEKLDEGDGA